MKSYSDINSQGLTIMLSVYDDIVGSGYMNKFEFESVDLQRYTDQADSYKKAMTMFYDSIEDTTINIVVGESIYDKDIVKKKVLELISQCKRDDDKKNVL